MARIRNIKPSFFINESLAELPMHTRMTFIGLWTISDRRGRLEDRPKRIKASLFPYDSFDMEEALVMLERAGFLIRYTATLATGEILKLIQIPNFEKHQRISGDEASKESEYPCPVVPTTTTDEVEEQSRSMEEASERADLGLRSTDIGHRSTEEIHTPEIETEPVSAPDTVACEVQVSSKTERTRTKVKPKSKHEIEAFNKFWSRLIDENGLTLTDQQRKTQAKACWVIAERCFVKFGVWAESGADSIVTKFLKFKAQDSSPGGFWRGQPTTPLTLSSQGVWDRLAQGVDHPQKANDNDEIGELI